MVEWPDMPRVPESHAVVKAREIAEIMELLEPMHNSVRVDIERDMEKYGE